MNTLAILENEGELFAIRPSQKSGNRTTETNPDKYEEIYQIGVKDTKAIMEQLKDYLAND